jgi:hypothetical protein
MRYVCRTLIFLLRSFKAVTASELQSLRSYACGFVGSVRPRDLGRRFEGGFGRLGFNRSSHPTKHSTPLNSMSMKQSTGSGIYTVPRSIPQPSSAGSHPVNRRRRASPLRNPTPHLLDTSTIASGPEAVNSYPAAADVPLTQQVSKMKGFDRLFQSFAWGGGGQTSTPQYILLFFLADSFSTDLEYLLTRLVPALCFVSADGKSRNRSKFRTRSRTVPSSSRAHNRCFIHNPLHAPRLMRLLSLSLPPPFFF